MSSLERAARQLSAEIDQLAAKLSKQNLGDISRATGLLESAESAAQLAKASSGELGAVLTDLKALQAKLVTVDNKKPEAD